MQYFSFYYFLYFICNLVKRTYIYVCMVQRYNYTKNGIVPNVNYGCMYIYDYSVVIMFFASIFFLNYFILPLVFMVILRGLSRFHLKIASLDNGSAANILSLFLSFLWMAASALFLASSAA